VTSESGWPSAAWTSNVSGSDSGSAVGRWRFFIFLKGFHWFSIGGIRVLGAREGAGLEGSNSVMRCLDPPASFWAVEVSSKVLTGLGFDWDFDDGTENESFIVSLLLSRIGSNREEDGDRAEAIRVLLRSIALR